MDFSEALTACEHGHKIQRAGWNGKGMYVFFMPKTRTDRGAGWFVLDADGKPKVIENTMAQFIEVEPYLCIFTADEKYIPWVVSQADVLADDWIRLIDESDYKPINCPVCGTQMWIMSITDAKCRDDFEPYCPKCEPHKHKVE